MAFSDRFPTPYGVKFEGGSFVAEFPETARDACIYNKMLDAWLACAKEKEKDARRLDEAVCLLDSICSILIMDQGQSKHPLNRYTVEIKKLLKKEDDRRYL